MKKINEQGLSSVFILLIIMVVVPMILLTTQTNIESSMKQQKTYYVVSSIQEYIANLATNIRHDYSWTKTINSPSNPGMACLKSPPTDCTGVPGGNFILYDPTGTIVNDATGNYGVNELGQFCQGGGSISTCLIKFTLSWQPLCPGGVCLNPPVQVTITPVLQYASPLLPINLNRFVTTIYR